MKRIAILSLCMSLVMNSLYIPVHAHEGEIQCSNENEISGVSDNDTTDVFDVSDVFDTWTADEVVEPEGDDLEEPMPDAASEFPNFNLLGTYGSGSIRLNSNPDDYRFYTEYMFKDTAGIPRANKIKVYMKAGETACFGSSVANSKIDKNHKLKSTVTGTDITITKPDGSVEGYDVVNSASDKTGYITDYTQEKNGPILNGNSADTDRYQPLTFVAPAEGIYVFDFHSETGAAVVPAPRKVTAQWEQKQADVAAWDITVVGSDNSGGYEVKTGRIWTDYIAMSSGAAGTTKSSFDLYVLTKDGYQYETKFNEAVPFGFVFFANNMGFTTTESSTDVSTTYSIYHSFYDSGNDIDINNVKRKGNISVHSPNTADTDLEETYKIFFNKPSDDIQAAGINKTTPGNLAQITSIKFSGNQLNTALYKQGGKFTIVSTGEANITVTLDLREALAESISEGNLAAGSYKGSGVVVLNGAVKAGENTFYWDGKDDEGYYIPIGHYAGSKVSLATEVKAGEIHFPILDMEGLYGGITISRINGSDPNSKIYYNNNPLQYGTIEGGSFSSKVQDNYYTLSDGTKTYKHDKNNNATDFAGKYYFTSLVNPTINPQNVSTLVEETVEGFKDYKHVAIDSANPTNSMLFTCAENAGGGNSAGIDIWAYFAGEPDITSMDFAVLDAGETGTIDGTVFYDEFNDAKYDVANGDYPLEGIKVRLVDYETGKPATHTVSLPKFDEEGYFVYDDGQIVYDTKTVAFETTTDSKGYYRFNGVPRSLDHNTTTQYSVQVMLTDFEQKVYCYMGTTTDKAYANDMSGFLNPSAGTQLDSNSGPDGNKVTYSKISTGIFKAEYHTTTNAGNEKEIVFDKANAQSLTLSEHSAEGHFKDIGYLTYIPESNRKSYKFVKDWPNGTPALSDGLTVQLWAWNDSEIDEENTNYLNRRTGALIDTVKIDAGMDWQYTWKHLDDRLQYFFLEFYTKKDDAGNVIVNDKGEERLIMIGGTMPLYSSKPSNDIYGFEIEMGDYPEYIIYDGKHKVPVQYYGDDTKHANAMTEREHQNAADTNSRQYDVSYTLKKEDGGKTNVITMTNSQTYDERAYYVWLDHEAELNDFVTKTYLDESTGSTEKMHNSVSLQQSEVKAGNIKGLVVSSVDAAYHDNTEGNATSVFQYDEADPTSVKFVATNHGNYTTGTGTRTYKAEYVTTGSGASEVPVEVSVDTDGKLVKYGTHIDVRNSTDYNVYTWTLTVHVYDVKPDGVYYYTNGSKQPVLIQKGLSAHDNISWDIVPVAGNDNAIDYENDDQRTYDLGSNGLIGNDVYRVPLYKHAEEDHMGSCADFVGIAYSPDGILSDQDAANLVYWDTHADKFPTTKSRQGEEDGKAGVEGKYGTLEVDLNVPRGEHITRDQDHLNYANVTYTPTGAKAANANAIDTFYYKVVIFSEETSYDRVRSYDSLDASNGVVMYTHVQLAPKKNKTPDKKPNPDKPTNPDKLNPDKPNPDGSNKNNAVIQPKQTKKPPKTGDDTPLGAMMILMFGSLALGGGCFTYYFRKRNRK